MAYEKLELLINGKFSAGTSGKSEPVINPATEEVIGHVPHASAADLDDAIAASCEGFKVWKFALFAAFALAGCESDKVVDIEAPGVDIEVDEDGETDANLGD